MLLCLFSSFRSNASAAAAAAWQLSRSDNVYAAHFVCVLSALFLNVFSCHFIGILHRVGATTAMAFISVLLEDAKINFAILLPFVGRLQRDNLLHRI